MGGFALGWNAAHEKNVDQRQRKQALSDEQRKLKVSDLYEQRNAIREQLATLPRDTPADLQAYNKAHDEAQASIMGIQTELEQLYHPVHAPGALQKDWNFLTRLITRRGPEQSLPAPVTTTRTPDTAITPDEEPITFPATTSKVRGPAGQVTGTTTPAMKVGETHPVLPGATYRVAGPAGAVPVAETMALPTAKVEGLVAPGNIPIWNRPTVLNGDGSHSTEFSTSFTDENKNSPYYGKEVLMPTVVDGKFLTPDGTKPPEGSQAEHAMKEAARKHYEETGQHLGVFESPAHADKYANVLHTRGDRDRPDPATYQPKLSPQQRKLQAGVAQAQKDADRFLAAGPLSPQQQAQADSAKTMAYITQGMSDFKKLRPDATPEEQTAHFNDLVTKAYGFVQQRAVWKEYQSPDGTKTWLDASRPDLIPPGYTAIGTDNADTRKRADFAEYQKEHPEYKGTFEQWGPEQVQLAKRAAPSSRDDRYIEIEQKRALGQPVSEDEQAYAAAYNLYVQKRVVDPGVARAAAFANNRYVQVMDPANPEKVIFMRAAEAAKQGAGSPAGIGFQTDKAVTRYMTVGKGAENINYFNTAISHLKLLSETADALDNHDIQRLNQFGNAFATATGSAAPTNFETVKSAVAGEVAKTFTGKGATVEEIGQINQVINQAESPEQLHGAINYYLSLMDGKLEALKTQYSQGKMGQPAFGGSGGGEPKSSRIMMKLPDTADGPGPSGPIDASQKEQFIKDYPGAVEVTVPTKPAGAR